MRPAISFIHMMPHEVTISPWTGFDGQGEPSWGSAVTYSARVSSRMRNIVDALGQEVVSAHTVWMTSAPLVNVLDKLTLTTGFVGSTEESLTTPPILAVGRNADGSGWHHTVLYLK